MRSRTFEQNYCHHRGCLAELSQAPPHRLHQPGLRRWWFQRLRRLRRHACCLRPACRRPRSPPAAPRAARAIVFGPQTKTTRTRRYMSTKIWEFTCSGAAYLPRFIRSDQQDCRTPSVPSVPNYKFGLHVPLRGICVCVIAHANGGSRGPRVFKAPQTYTPVLGALVSPLGQCAVR